MEDSPRSREPETPSETELDTGFDTGSDAEARTQAVRPPADRLTFFGRLREKAPEIVLEAISVVLAVFLALAVNGRAEERKQEREAEKARQGVLDEIRSNYDEILSSYEENLECLQVVEEGVVALKRVRDQRERGEEASPPDGLSVDFSLSLLSSASWQAAQMTSAVNHLDYAWISRVARLYELQGVYLDRQADLVAFLASLPTMREGEELQTMSALAGRLRTTLGILDGLVQSYAGIHPELELPPELERRTGEQEANAP